ncbi:fungal-specific transcription factor domain-containing protein [Penicillium chermesinum]|uniref:Fungal-specific transcription factor domain-containing protein n=1 Tax=Penicillium chermesinum TaxID=63820 RepID=A0A9W9NU55_9EURO|nr:fungal-specific transcription factor domain-containing protein [Penicillium chermesinum]KAJ5226063.1 fungal-specific transcription factor domain-containing protein [Penicillium chermesinum]
MSGQLRSKNGCWTCRLRRKKCDEARPQCDTCVSLSIPCYGYGPKPDWMGSGEEKDVVSGLKKIVKRTWRNKSAAKPVQRDRKPFIAPAPKAVEASAGNSPSGVSDPDAATGRGNGVVNSSDRASFDTPSTKNLGSSLWPSALITTEQEKQLEVSLIELQNTMRSVGQFVSATCPREGLGILASIIQLVFFELFAREGTAWRVHLKASTDMYHRILEDRLTHLGLTEAAQVIINDGLSGYEDGPVIRDEVIAFRFFSGTVFWLDIVSSMTAGTAPKLLAHHSLIENSINIDLWRIVGCKNWVMVKLGLIASLQERKIQSQQRDIEGHMAQDQMEGLTFSAETYTSLDPMLPRSVVTRAYGYMALVYLHLVGHGFEDLDVVDSTFNEAIRLLQTNMTAQILPALVCPLFVIACVSCESHQQYFRMHSHV